MVSICLINLQPGRVYIDFPCVVGRYFVFKGKKWHSILGPTDSIITSTSSRYVVPDTILSPAVYASESAPTCVLVISEWSHPPSIFASLASKSNLLHPPFDWRYQRIRMKSSVTVVLTMCQSWWHLSSLSSNSSRGERYTLTLDALGRDRPTGKNCLCATVSTSVVTLQMLDGIYAGTIWEVAALQVLLRWLEDELFAHVMSQRTEFPALAVQISGRTAQKGSILLMSWTLSTFRCRCLSMGFASGLVKCIGGAITNSNSDFVRIVGLWTRGLGSIIWRWWPSHIPTVRRCMRR